VPNVTVTGLSSTHTPVATVYAIDTSSSMNAGGKLADVRAALAAQIQSKASNEQVAIVAYGGAARIVQGLTADPAILTGAINSLSISGAPLLNDGIQTATSLLVPLSGELTQIVVIGDAPDGGSIATGSQAVGDIQAVSAMVVGVGLRYGTTSPPALTAIEGLATSTVGGQYIEATSSGALPAAFSQLHQVLAGEYELTFPSRTTLPADLIVTTAGLSAQGQITSGAAVGSAINPSAVTIRQAPGPLKGRTGLLLIAVLILAGGGLLTYAVLALVMHEDTSLTGALRPYTEPLDQGSASDEDDGSLVQTAILQRAVETTRRIAEERGVLDAIETKLDQADIALRPAEALFFYLAGAILLAALAIVSFGPLLGLVFALGLALAPPAILWFLAGQRLRKFNSQLPDTLQLLSSSLRAGFSFMQGVEAVSQEVAEPMGGELRRVIIEARLGRPVEDSLAECAARMRSPDFDWAVMAVSIQREVGGNLADLLQTVGMTMVERERLRRDVRSLTAEGRMSAIVLGILPPAMGVAFYVLNPAYIEVLFNHTGGEIALGVAVVAMIVGFAWMQKIVNIEV
jgi:tight adherence protein B